MKKFLKLFAVLVIIAATFNFSVTSAKELTLEKIIQITSTTKGFRPSPNTYLSKKYIKNHLKKFKNGVSIVMGVESYNKFVLNSKTIGRSDGCFVMPKYICDNIEKKYGGDISIFETSLSFDAGYFALQGGMVRLDIFDIEDLNLRLPSGNETGANEYWLPGGFTRGGIPEAILDPIPKERALIKFY